MRLFTALDIPPEVRASLGALIDRLRPLAKLHWIPSEKLHVTTKFIGEWPEDRLAELTSALAKVAAPAPVEVSIRRIGWLPNPRSARTLYAGVEASDSLNVLAGATEQALEPIGIPREQRIYRPHITLARTRHRVSLEALKTALAAVELSDFTSYGAKSFALYLSANGKYTKLQDFVL